MSEMLVVLILVVVITIGLVLYNNINVSPAPSANRVQANRVQANRAVVKPSSNANNYAPVVYKPTSRSPAPVASNKIASLLRTIPPQKQNFTPQQQLRPQPASQEPQPLSAPMNYETLTGNNMTGALPGRNVNLCRSGAQCLNDNNVSTLLDNKISLQPTLTTFKTYNPDEINKKWQAYTLGSFNN